MNSTLVALAALASGAILGAVVLFFRQRQVGSELQAIRSIVERAPDSVLVANVVDGQILWANDAAAELVASSTEALEKKRIHELFPTNLVGRSAEIIAEAWEKKGLTSSDLCFIASDGEEIPVEISGTVIKLHRVNSVVLFARDIRTRKQLEARLVQTEKVASLGQLVAGVAHELNTPLGSIRACTDVGERAVAKLRDAVDGDPKVSKALDALTRAVGTVDVASERIDGIVRSLRSFARLDEAERKVVDVHEGIESTLTLMQHELRDHVAVERAFSSLPPIDCYPSELNQAFMHIVKNAVQAMPNGGTLSIETESADGGARLTFVDSGTGIEASNLKRIFDPGYTTKGVGVGTGLGLSICQQIVALHGGKIEADSTPGAGTRISIWLPEQLAADAAKA